MKSLSNFQIFPIINDQEFEEFVCDIFNSIDKTNSYELFGRKGQNQYGIDIYSFEKETVIQCKHKLIDRPDNKIREELIEDFKNEIDRFKNFNESNGNRFKKFIVASTFKNDTLLATACIALSVQYNISFEYWSWKRLTKYVGDEIFDKYFSYFSRSLELYYSNTTHGESLIPMDDNLPFLKQVYDFLSMRFRDIKILHSRMFLNENVFKNKLNDYSRRRVFSYKTYNDVFFNLIERLEFKDNVLVNNSGEDQSQFLMFDFITKTLTENGIYTIYGKKFGQGKNIINRKNKPEDYFDYFEKFKFIEAFKALPVNVADDTLDEILRQGYFYYKIGDLLKSKDLFQIASIKALEQDRKISYLISQHNLLHLAKFIEWGYYRLTNKTEILKELKNISIDIIEVDAIDIKIKEIIVSRSFFSSAKDSIQSYANKVEETYFAYLRGVRNSVNYEEEIDYEYSILHAFISKNYIVYDQYSDYTEIINNLFNTLMASYSIKNGRNRVEYLNDFYLYHFVEYGDIKEFEKYLKRYDIFEISYEKLEEQDYQFVSLFINFTNNSTPELNALLEENGEYLVENFKERFNKVFRNFLFFSGILKLETGDVSNITKGVFMVLSNEKIIEKYNSDSIYNYFIRKNKQIENSQLVRFIFYILENEGYYNSNKLISLFNELHYNKINLSFTRTQFSFLIKNLNDKIEQSEDYHLIVTLFWVLIPEQQQILISNLLEKLNIKFDRDLCSLMLIYDLIDYNTNCYFDLFIESIDIEKEYPSNRDRDFDGNSGPKRYAVVDDLFNIVFKYDISLADSRFDKFRGISDYYDWLMDIEHFDYAKFDPYWISKYGTQFYHAHMKRHEKVLKKEVLKHISTTQDARLKEIIYNIFCFEEQ
jgi:hypothetical protein